MEVKELMIGDWIKVLPISKKVKPHYERIESIKKEYGDRIYIEGGYHDREHNGVEDWFDWSVGLRYIEPIPLTAEILAKNNFSKNYGYYSYPNYKFEDEDEKVLIIIGFPEKGKSKRRKTFIEIDCVDSNITCYCEFVHEMQHALRLAGLKMADNLKV